MRLCADLLLLPWRVASTLRVCVVWAVGAAWDAWLRLWLGRVSARERALLDGARAARNGACCYALGKLWRTSND